MGLGCDYISIISKSGHLESKKEIRTSEVNGDAFDTGVNILRSDAIEKQIINQYTNNALLLYTSIVNPLDKDLNI
jgi:hypothetical protein